MSKLILSLDGGGIRGAATTQFLSHVETALQNGYNRSIRDCVDFYAGTSTGSIIALALATTDLPMDQINELYNHENAEKIFAEYEGFLDIDGVNAPKYKAKGKTKQLKKNLGESRIGDVPDGKHVLVVTYALEKRQPVVIKSTRDEFRDLFAWQAADASSAAPTYFPTRELEMPDGEEDYWLIDGGINANNPTMCTIAEARHVWPDESLGDLRVLSVGTGYLTRKINGPESKKWGGLQWITKGRLLDLLMDERVVAYQALAITDNGNYIRVNAELKSKPWLPKPPDDAMDDISKGNIKKLKKLGDFWFEQYGEAAVSMLVDEYQGPSLDRIDPHTGKPIVNSGN